MRIAIAGLGFMGCTHLTAFQKIDGVEVVAVVSSDPVKLSGDLSGVGGNLGSDFGQVDFSRLRKYESVEQAIEDPEIDAIDICLPTDRHFPVALAAIRGGKDVLVEKPISLDGRSADELVDEARNSGRILMVGHVLRFIPAYRELGSILKEGRLGPVRSAFFRRRCGAPNWSRWLTDPSRSGGAVLDLLIHDIDFCLYLFGKPILISATGYQSAELGIDVSEARFTYDAGSQVVIEGGWHHPGSYPFSMEFTVVSDAGTLEYSSAGTPLTLYSASGSADAIRLDAESDPFVQELAYFAQCVRTREQPALCPPTESALAVKIAGCMVESRSKKGEPVECPN